MGCPSASPLRRARFPATLAGLAAALAAVARCGAPGDPELGRASPPTAAADVLCLEPGFPRDIGETAYNLLDMDQGKQCQVFLEQDECVLAIFEDCTDLTTLPREWQGRATVDRAVLLAPVYPDNGIGVRIPRSPACCEGPVMPDGGSPEWMRLDCRLQTCNSSNRAHTGLYLSRDLIWAPALTASVSETITAAPTARGAAGLWDPARAEGWLAWPGAGLFVRPRAGPARAIAGISSAALLAQDDRAVFVADGADLYRVTKATRAVSEPVALPGPALAMTRVDEGLLVGTDNLGRTELALYDSESLMPRATNLVDGPVTGLAPRPRDGIALATFDDPPRLLVLTATLAVASNTLMADLAQLSAEGVVPFAPQLVSPQRVVFAGECYGNAAGPRCYYEHPLADPDARSERIGLPDVERLTAIAVTADGAEAWVAAAGGLVHRIPRDPLRPRPEQVTTVGHDVAALIDTGRSLWAVSETGQLTILTASR